MEEYKSRIPITGSVAEDISNDNGTSRQKGV